jgi:hypothetical protein
MLGGGTSLPAPKICEARRSICSINRSCSTKPLKPEPLADRENLS